MHADSSAVSLAEIKTALGLTDLGISDETLEQLLGYPAKEQTSLRALAEIATLRFSYLNKVQKDFLDAYEVLVKASLGAVYDLPDWQNILHALADAAIDKALDELSAFVVNITLDSILFARSFLDVVSAAYTLADKINIMQISYWYYAWSDDGYADLAEWQSFCATFPFNANAVQWLREHGVEARTAAISTCYALRHSQEILAFKESVALLIRQRVDTYKAYRAGQYTECVTSSPTTVIVINNGQYPITSVVLGNERPLFPDEVSETFPEIPSSGGKGVMSFVSGVENIDYLEFNVLGARARTDFRTSAVLPIISAPTISSFGDFAPKEIAFDASHSIISQNVTVSEYRWDFGDNSGTQSGISIPHVYQLPGTYQATLTAVTSAGNATATKAISVLNPVSASFTVTPDNGPLSTVFQFDGSASSTSVGTISSWSWDFGDGLPAGAGVQPAHQYATEGFKTVSLTVTNSYGASASASKTVVVGTQQPTNVSGVTAVGADAIWLGNISDPLIYTAPYHLYDYFSIGADAVWHKGLDNPAIDTQPQHLYDYFTIGADAFWHRNLSNPNIDTVLSHIYDYFAIGADAIWHKSLSSPAIQTTPANQYSYFAVGADAVWSRGLSEPNFSIIIGITAIGDIKQNPAAYDGKTVTISGAYRGWEVGHGKSPLTRSDWVIRDSTGSIYVTGSSLGLVYPRDVGKAIEIRGTVRLKTGQPYIELVK